MNLLQIILSLEHLQNEGFQALGATWFKPDNITSYAQFAKENQVTGMIQTRWTGYFGNSSLLAGQYNQAYAYLNAANAFWNTNAPPLEDAPQYFRDNVAFIFSCSHTSRPNH